MLANWILIAAGAVHFLSAAAAPSSPNTVIQVEIREESQGQDKVPEGPKLTAEESRRVNFGHYAVPQTLQSLLDLQEELGDSERFYDALYFNVNTGNFRYASTPSDVIVFGNVGVDGIHFGFLTDYGTVTDLEEAPIVTVSPMDFDRPTRIVARNLREFLRVNLTDENLFINSFRSEAEYLEAKRRWAEEEKNSPYRRTEEEIQARQKVVEELGKRIPMPEIGTSAFAYVQNANEERSKRITVPTMDGLGVTVPLEHGRTHEAFPVNKDDGIDLEKLRAYLAGASRADKLALFRDIQMNFILPQEKELRTLILAELRSLGLNEEAARIDESY
ncbi:MULTISPECIES: hypothetical protein [Paenibacillus]|uniref:hypothetical protein n=1 Tax=Paenibacillus TaxID=44249 RepID=UPI0022B8F195|nr:hypothetical protein [Paenibacillus caseinilyticus]MCZ8520357.1 hypothetical protein [Paenibacillus caseinilyticus]